MLFGGGGLPKGEVPEGMTYLRENIPGGIEWLLAYWIVFIYLMLTIR